MQWDFEMVRFCISFNYTLISKCENESLTYLQLGPKEWDYLLRRYVHIGLYCGELITLQYNIVVRPACILRYANACDMFITLCRNLDNYVYVHSLSWATVFIVLCPMWPLFVPLSPRNFHHNKPYTNHNYHLINSWNGEKPRIMLFQGKKREKSENQL